MCLMRGDCGNRAILVANLQELIKQRERKDQDQSKQPAKSQKKKIFANN